jgi:hypothetical protein
MDVTDLSDKPGLARQKMQCVVFRNREQGPLVDVGIAGRPAVVVTFTLFSPMLERLFKCRLMSFRDFCQSFIDGYQIPELKKSENSSSMNYQSSDGWKVVLGTRTGNDKTVLLYATPTKIDQGFGQ